MKEIESAGKVYPVKYGMAALSEFLDSEGLSLSDMENIGKNMSLTRALKLVYFGLKHGARKAGKDFAFTLDDIGDMCDDDPELLQKCMTVFSESMPQSEVGNKQAPAKRTGAKR